MLSQIKPTGGKLGDVFWDLPPWTTYYPGFDLGCTVYVANPTDDEKEYALLARLYRNEVLLVEEVLSVYGHTWFTVMEGDFIRLFGYLRYDETDVVLVVDLIERETEEVADSVSTMLVSPAAAALPPAWPVAPAAPGVDWLSLMMMLMMMVTMGGIMVSALRPQKEKVEAPPPEEEGLLPPPRRDR